MHRSLALVVVFVALPAHAQVVKIIFDNGPESTGDFNGDHFISGPSGNVFFASVRSGVASTLMSDGTSAGTIPVVADTSFPFVGCPGFVLVDDSDTGTTVRTDGTAAGTFTILNASTAFHQGVCLGSIAVFSAVAGNGLFVTDGTAAGTSQLVDPLGALTGVQLSGFAAIGGVAFFAGTSDAEGTEIWRTDGTSFGTRLVQDTTPGTASTDPVSFTASGSHVFVVDRAGDLLVTDGNDSGTGIIAAAVNPVLPTAAMGGVVFRGGPAGNQALMFADSVSAVNLTQPGTLLSSGVAPASVAAVGTDLAFFDVEQTGDDNVDGFYTTDGTAAGTTRFAPLFVDSAGDRGCSQIGQRCAGAGSLAYCECFTTQGLGLVVSDGKNVTVLPADEPVAITAIGNDSVVFDSQIVEADGEFHDRLGVALGGCGDGAVTFGEECDNAVTTTCCSQCSFDSPTAACDTGGAFCDGPGLCDGAGSCVPQGDPCSETDCNHCDETRRSCLDLVDTACGDPSSSVCDDPDTCNGAGVCLANHKSTSTVCRPSVDGINCDLPESCNANGTCPADAKKADNARCNDGNACDAATCQAGRCTFQSELTCDDGNICTADSCAEPNGCLNTPIPNCCRFDSDCNDHNSCTRDSCDFVNARCNHVVIAGCAGEGEGEGAAGEGEGATGEGEGAAGEGEGAAGEGEGAAGEGEGAAGEGEGAAGEGEGAAGEGEGAAGEGEGAAGEGEGEGGLIACQSDLDCPTNGVVCDTAKHVCVKKADVASGCTCNDASASPPFIALAGVITLVRRRRRR